MSPNGNFSYPNNVSHFLWLYQTSKFLSCDQNLANRMKNEYKLYQNENQQNLTVEPMKYIAQSLDLLEKRYWLAGGTLLGKLSFEFVFEFEFEKNHQVGIVIVV